MSEVKTEIHIKIYVPEPADPTTHVPEITFSGTVLSMRELDFLEFRMRKALRKYKQEQSKQIVLEGLEPCEDIAEKEISDGSE